MESVVNFVRVDDSLFELNGEVENENTNKMKSSWRVRKKQHLLVSKQIKVLIKESNFS